MGVCGCRVCGDVWVCEPYGGVLGCVGVVGVGIFGGCVGVCNVIGIPEKHGRVHSLLDPLLLLRITLPRVRA